MPYIPKRERPYLDPTLAHDAVTNAKNPGELNFQLATLVDKYLDVGLNYQRLNDVIGVLECLKLEVARRVVAPYEDRKIIDNGEVFVCLSNLPKRPSI